MPGQRKHSAAALLLALLAGCAPVATPGARARDPEVRNVIFMVLDGGGVGVWSAAELAVGNLAVRRMPVLGLVDTQSSSSRVTDSAAGATVYASGIRTYNDAIGVGPECWSALRADTVAARMHTTTCPRLETVFDHARRAGKALGLLTTTSVADATPAAFASSAPSRAWQELIANQYAEAGLDVLVGGGRRWFSRGGRPDSTDLYERMCAPRAYCAWTPEQLRAYRPHWPLVALLAWNDLEPAGRRDPPFPELVEVALSRLGRDPDGFFALLESEGIDNATHDNRPLGVVTQEVVEFDRGVRVALEFAERTPGTLLIVTADHETGGFSLPLRTDTTRAPGTIGRDTLAAAYTTGGHTANLVPLFAYGPGAERFGGLRDNEEIGWALLDLARRWR